MAWLLAASAVLAHQFLLLWPGVLMSLYKIKLTDIGRGEGGLSSECQQSGKMVDSASPKKSPKDSARPWKLYRRAGKSSQLISERGAVTVVTTPTVCRLLTPCDLPLDTVLFTRFVPEITEGEVKEESWSSVNYWFFISPSLIYGKNWQVRQGVVWWKIWKVSLGWKWGCLGRSQLHCSFAEVTRKGASCWGWFPAKSCLCKLESSPESPLSLPWSCRTK